MGFSFSLTSNCLCLLHPWGLRLLREGLQHVNRYVKMKMMSLMRMIFYLIELLMESVDSVEFDYFYFVGFFRLSFADFRIHSCSFFVILHLLQANFNQ